MTEPHAQNQPAISNQPAAPIHPIDPQSLIVRETTTSVILAIAVLICLLLSHMTVLLHVSKK